ncbi:laccase [Elysia marginata]|uniref:Laccase n=1 Tax=Elysia marginata TaxID=1093978 RepID=A0AAV4HID4_9GAST|nr:laccase [Elysia marginata]
MYYQVLPVPLAVPLVLLLIQCCVWHARAKLLHHMSYDDMEDYKDHPCIRPCLDDTETMVCDYNFLVERYHTLTRACWGFPIFYLPRPLGNKPHFLFFKVCEGDTIRVRVHNKMENAESMTIHWHGLHQRHSQHMDGVAMVTQCPIPPHTAFTYVFKANPPGTHFWHAHSGLQRADGLYGNLVVRRSPKREPHLKMYDFDLPEHTLNLLDWWGRNVVSSFADHYHGDGSNKPDSILINGKGISTDKDTQEKTTTPREVFEVQQGSRYRFRVISNAVMNCPMKISIDGHDLEVIASDGYDVEPLRVQYFNIFAGERFDFVLLANQSVGNYLLRVQGELDCGANRNNAHQTAIIHYKNSKFDPHFWVDPPYLEGKGLNPINRRGTDKLMTVNELRSLPGEMDEDLSLKPYPDRSIVLAMDFSMMNNPRFHDQLLYSVQDFPMSGGKNRQTPQINDITFAFPSSPALTQLTDIPKTAFCNRESLQGKNCSAELCECIHHYRIDLGDVVELILIDQGHIWDVANHPTHLHGYGFRVLAMDKLGKFVDRDDVTSLDQRGGISRNRYRPPKKDTVTIPDGGYTIVRFHADNPGMWLLHCHLEYHAEIGMAVLLQVGDTSQLPPTPRQFPTCGNWQPEEELDWDEEQHKLLLGGDGEIQSWEPTDGASSFTRAGFYYRMGVTVVGLVTVKLLLVSDCW